MSDVRYSKYQRTMEGMGGLDGPGYSKGLVGLEGQYNKLRSVLKVRAFRGSGRFREVQMVQKFWKLREVQMVQRLRR